MVRRLAEFDGAELRGVGKAAVHFDHAETGPHRFDYFNRRCDGCSCTEGSSLFGTEGVVAT